jgi:hypothetical protein
MFRLLRHRCSPLPIQLLLNEPRARKFVFARSGVSQLVAIDGAATGSQQGLPRVPAVRNSYRRSDLVPVPLARLAVADRHVQALTVLPCRDDGQVSSSGRASVVDL